MDDALSLSDYLPVSFGIPAEREYIAYLWEAFEANYNAGRHQFTFLSYHMLMMSFVYFSIWKIRQSRPDDFSKGLIGFRRDDESTLLNNTSPFEFSAVNESSVLRLLRLIECDNSKIGQYLKLVRDRNDMAHANGHIFLNTQDQLDTQINEVLRAVDEIQTYSQPIISHLYETFLLQSYDPGEREFPDTEDQIREVLIHKNYISRKDIEVFVNFDISTLDIDDKIAIETLHNTLRETYAPA